MKIIIQPQGTLAIYEQIVSQLKDAIVTGDLKAGEALPSIRALAGDLQVSVITTKRAYEDLERDKFIVTVVGKGSFVAEKNLEFLREEHLRQTEEHLTKAIISAKLGGIALEEMQEMLSILYEEGN